MTPRSIVDILNRPSQKKQQEIAKVQEGRKRGPWLTRNAKWIAFLFFNFVALVFDAFAVTTVYTLTNHSILFAILALLPTGIPMFMWEAGWLNPLADTEQKTRAIWGVILSVISAVIVGFSAIFVDVGDANLTFWVSIILLGWCVLAVITHGVMAALYFYKDPITIRDHSLQSTISENEFQQDTLKAGKDLMDSAATMLKQEAELREQFGDSAVNRTLEILLGIDLNHDGKIGGQSIPQRTQTQPMVRMAKDDDMAQLRDNHREPVVDGHPNSDGRK